MKKLQALSRVLLVSAVCSYTLAATPEQEANRLGNELTPLGGERAGNADGSIPAWDGGLKAPPAQYSDGEHMIDPFADDQPLFEITSANFNDHSAQLTDGQRAMFEKYPESFRMHIYPTRRTAHVPDEVAEKAKRNVLTAQLVDDGNGVDNYDSYYPFPIPDNALEVLWNHFMRYRGGSLEREHSQIITQTNGGFHEVKLSEIAVYPERMKDHDPDKDNNTLVYFRQIIKAPARLTGNVLLVHDTVNQIQQPRNAWIYNAGQRRVRRAPQVAYDGPGTAADGMRTADNFDMFTGAPDRYDWSLDGKLEVYIPYNNYRLASSDLRYDQLIQKGHLNQDFIRYEKHRVWKVTATLKEGMRHIYAKRVFYFDEDTWQIAYVDQFDARGELWRVSEGYHVQYYYADTPWLAGEAIYDLIAGRYLVMGLTSESNEPVRFGMVSKKVHFTPSAIRRLGIR